MKLKSLRRGMPAPKGDVGIELEMEGANLPAYDLQGRGGATVISDHWSIVSDGSLRNGAEYILTAPVETKIVPDVLQEMEALMKAHKSKPVYSLRTSSHVHINVNDLDYDHVLNYIYLYGLVENVITKMCGRSRLANRFCLRLCDAEGTIESICKMIETRRFGGRGFYANLDEGRMKYAAINTVVLYKYGSLEFRAMEGTNDWPRLLIWISTLLSLRKAAQEYQDIGEIFSDLNKIGAKDFFFKILGKNAEHHWNDAVENELVTAASITYDFVLTSNRNIPGEAGPEEEDRWGMLPYLNEELNALAHPYQDGYRFEGTKVAKHNWIMRHIAVKQDPAINHGGAFYYVDGATLVQARQEEF